MVGRKSRRENCRDLLSGADVPPAALSEPPRAGQLIIPLLF